MLSKYCSSIANNYEIKVGEVNKLIPNLDNKKNTLQKSSIVSAIRNESDKIS